MKKPKTKKEGEEVGMDKKKRLPVQYEYSYIPALGMFVEDMKINSGTTHRHQMGQTEFMAILDRVSPFVSTAGSLRNVSLCSSKTGMSTGRLGLFFRLAVKMGIASKIGRSYFFAKKEAKQGWDELVNQMMSA